MDDTHRPIIVNIGKERYRATFELSPRSEHNLGSLPARSCPARVTVAFEEPWDFGDMADPMWMHIVMLLTGLDHSQILALGGVRFVVPGENEVVFETLAA